jgi:hypothetical protein
VEYLFTNSDLKDQIKKFELVDENNIVILRFEFNPFKLNLGVKECFLSYKNMLK